MPVTHTVQCDYKCNKEVEVSISEYGLELPDTWDAWTVLSSLMRGTGLTFYRCPAHRSLSPGEFLRYALDEIELTGITCLYCKQPLDNGESHIHGDQPNQEE